MNPIGITTWIWTSPLTTDRFPEIAQHVARLGFDLLEVPIEGTGDLDYKKAARHRQGSRAEHERVRGDEPGPRPLHADASVRANAHGVREALHRRRADARRDQRGRTALQRGRPHVAGDRRRAQEGSRPARRRAQGARELTPASAASSSASSRSTASRRASSISRRRRSRSSIASIIPACGLLLDTFHMNIEEQSIGDAIRSAGPRLKHLHACENDRGAPGSGHIAVGRSRRGVPRDQLSGPGGDRVVHRRREIDRPRRRDLAPAGADTQDGLAQDGLQVPSQQVLE